MTDYKISPELLTEITAERQRQIDDGFTAEWEDENKTLLCWYRDVFYYLSTAQHTANTNLPARYRHHMARVLERAIAACESYDRLNKTGE